MPGHHCNSASLSGKPCFLPQVFTRDIHPSLYSDSASVPGELTQPGKTAPLDGKLLRESIWWSLHRFSYTPHRKQPEGAVEPTDPAGGVLVEETRGRPAILKPGGPCCGASYKCSWNPERDSFKLRNKNNIILKTQKTFRIDERLPVNCKI